MEGAARRQEILSQLAETTKPISASRFAKQFGVSRQVIVGDIALLRASGEEIIATARGYKKEDTSGKKISKIAVQHRADQTRQELETIVSLGGEIIDVIVEHDIYGELVGGLHISTQEDVEAFMVAYEESRASLLSQLTNGIHLHTISYTEDSVLENIKESLTKEGILYQGNEKADASI